MCYSFMYWYYATGAYASPRKPTGPKIYMIWGIGYLALGLYLLDGAPHLLRFGYPGPEPPE
jgi:hypothetical protein